MCRTSQLNIILCFLVCWVIGCSTDNDVLSSNTGDAPDVSVSDSTPTADASQPEDMDLASDPDQSEEISRADRGDLPPADTPSDRVMEDLSLETGPDITHIDPPDLVADIQTLELPTDSAHEDRLEGDLIDDRDEADLPIPGDLSDEETVEDLTPPVAGLPFSPGPYSAEFWGTAGDFTVNTTNGAWTFSEEWNGEDVYVFNQYALGYTWPEQMWTSSIDDLLATSPMNVHYFFSSFDATYTTDVNVIQNRVRAAIARLEDVSDQDHWNSHIHFITDQAWFAGGWISEFFATTGGFFGFTVDRYQRVREVGYPNDLTNDGLYKLTFMGHQARYHNYEWEREAAKESESATVFNIFDHVIASDSGWTGDSSYGEITLPSADTMDAYDTLTLDLTLDCIDLIDTSCPAWDYLVYLYLCDQDNPDNCNTEIARWITPYGRPGQWTTDSSYILSLLSEGGTRRFRFYTVQEYVTTLDLRLSSQETGPTPDEAHFLWSGGTYNEDYNDAHPPITVTLPDDVERVELVALITGHGWGEEVANCAEFCNHTHHFEVGGFTYSKEHPEAGTSYGCLEQIDSGTVPNQFGTWPFGRGGWCAGLDVTPFVVDITEAVTPGEENTFTYYSLVGGVPYVPVPSGLGDGFGANIEMLSYLVYWR